MNATGRYRELLMKIGSRQPSLGTVDYYMRSQYQRINNFRNADDELSKAASKIAGIINHLHAAYDDPISQSCGLGELGSFFNTSARKAIALILTEHGFVNYEDFLHAVEDRTSAKFLYFNTNFLAMSTTEAPIYAYHEGVLG